MSVHTVFGIDIGGTTTKIALVSKDAEIVQFETIPTSGHGDPAVFVPTLLDRILKVREASTQKGIMVNGIGIAVAGFLNSARDCIVYNPNLEPLVGFPLAATIRDHFGLPVVLDADSNTACLGELYFGVGRDSSRLLSITIGTGLGIGMAVDGKIVRTAYECMGDAGHVIVNPTGPTCSAGCHGCAEALVSASALEACFQRISGEKKSTREIVNLAHARNESARLAIAETGRWLGLAIASLATIFFPKCIVVSGGLSEADELLLAPARESFRASAAPFCAEGVMLRRAALGWRATVVGAAAMLMEI